MDTRGEKHLVETANLRFTQDSIGLYFKPPHAHVNVREMVRKFSRNEIGPSQFPPIRVVYCEGCLWAVDNRRLWVFKWARCPTVEVMVVTGSHPRLEELIANVDLYRKLRELNFFPRIRDKGEKDPDFYLVFSKPVYYHVHQPVQKAPGRKPAINMKEQQHAQPIRQAKAQWVVVQNQSTLIPVQDRGMEADQPFVPIRHDGDSLSTKLTRPLIDAKKDHVSISFEDWDTTLTRPLIDAKDEYPQSGTARGWNIFSTLWKIPVSIGKKIANFARNVCSVARGTVVTIHRKATSVGTGIRNYVCNMWFALWSIPVSIGRKIANFVWDVYSYVRETVFTVARKIAGVGNGIRNCACHMCSALWNIPVSIGRKIARFGGMMKNAFGRLFWL